MARLDPDFLENLGRYRKYRPDSLRDLLRVIRNKHNHFRELPEPLQAKLGPMPEGFLRCATCAIARRSTSRPLSHDSSVFFATRSHDLLRAACARSGSVRRTCKKPSCLKILIVKKAVLKRCVLRDLPQHFLVRDPWHDERGKRSWWQPELF